LETLAPTASGRVIGQVFRATVSPAVRIVTGGTVP
jgi:hypothetical protein